MNNHRCRSQKSLIPIRKWLLEAGDGLSTRSKLNHNVKQKIHSNKIIKRKKIYSKTTSIIDWFYEFIKKVFTVYDANPLKSNEQRDYSAVDETSLSIMTCSTCQLENSDTNINTNQSKIPSNMNNSDLHLKIIPKIMVTTATSNPNFHIFQPTILHSSKSIRIQSNHNEQYLPIYPFYCFLMKDEQRLPSSPLRINNKKSKYSDLPLDLPLETAIQSCFLYQPTITSISNSHSNIISLQTTQNIFEENDLLSKIPHHSSSLHDTHICHFDRCNCCSNTNTDAPEIAFAKSTCQLIKQAWLSSTSDKQINF